MGKVAHILKYYREENAISIKEASKLSKISVTRLKEIEEFGDATFIETCILLDIYQKTLSSFYEFYNGGKKIEK